MWATCCTQILKKTTCSLPLYWIQRQVNSARPGKILNGQFCEMVVAYFKQLGGLFSLLHYKIVLALNLRNSNAKYGHAKCTQQMRGLDKHETNWRCECCLLVIYEIYCIKCSMQDYSQHTLTSRTFCVEHMFAYPHPKMFLDIGYPYPLFGYRISVSTSTFRVLFPNLIYYVIIMLSTLHNLLIIWCD